MGNYQLQSTTASNGQTLNYLSVTPNPYRAVPPQHPLYSGTKVFAATNNRTQ